MEEAYFPLRARYASNEVQILVKKRMPLSEMLEALANALSLSPFCQIVGFKDPVTGMIIPPSIVCSDPDQIIKNQAYNVLVRKSSQPPFQGSLGGDRHSSSN